jgi:taurine--2-oxoglutarate transaminase
MSGRDLARANLRHSLFSWSSQAGLRPPTIAAGDGAHLVDGDGRRVLDLASLVFNATASLGHPRIAQAIAHQASVLPAAAPSMATEIRARYGEALAEATPRGLDRFLFTLGGADANEHAIKIARMVTGRPKIVTRYRSYHGSTLGALSATGDPRRLPFEPGVPGVVRVLDPYCYRCPFDWTPDVCRRPCLAHVDEVIGYEGPETIAAVLVEAVAGTNGAFVPPPEYLPGLRALCDRHGILLIADEVLTGFGRTGRWFAVDHWDVVPDLMTMGKGITSGHAPLGAVAVGERVARHFDERPLATGLTHSAHPVSLAAGLATLEVMRDEGLVERAAAMGGILAERFRDLRARRPRVGDARGLGLWGVLELVRGRDSREPLVPWNGPPASQEPMQRLVAAALERGVRVATRWNYLFVAPPLCIAEADLHAGLDVLDAVLGEETR